MSDLFTPSEEDPKLKKLLDEARAKGGATEAELQEQRVSWVYGNLPVDSKVTKEKIRQDISRIKPVN